MDALWSQLKVTYIKNVVAKEIRRAKISWYEKAYNIVDAHMNHEKYKNNDTLRSSFKSQNLSTELPAQIDL